MKVFIGTSGYFYWEWKGKFYPVDLKPDKWFEYYAKYFNTLEINSTFYRFPTISSLKRWYKVAPEGFIYSIKVNKKITHLKKFKDTKDILRQFYTLSYGTLKEKLGVFLFQLPPSFGYTKTNLKLITSQLDNSFKNAIEFRDKSWFSQDVFKLLKKQNIIFCCISAPEFNDICKNTAKTVYVRFHGKKQWYKYRYSKDELKKWAEMIVDFNPEEIFIYFNNTYNAYAVENALQMKEIFNQI